MSTSPTRGFNKRDKAASPAPSTATGGSTASGGGDAPPTASLPESYTNDKNPDDSSKLKTLLSILRRFIGVTDIASVRFSLPAQLLEPTPNLEYWNYLDRPETFASIGDSKDALERMLSVLRFWFTKDLKYVKGKPCKPYNSALGEFFRCNWDVDQGPPPKNDRDLPTTESQGSSPPGHLRISYITEQTSHHPPVSAYWITCPEKQITAYGFDQLAAKFTGTAIKVTPGVHNLGIFINLGAHDNEEYQLTHPIAQLGGLIRGSLSVTVADTCFITCPKTRIRVILHYLEESWLGKTQNKVHGVIYTYDPASKTQYSKIKDVPETDILARLEGSWHEKIYYTLASKTPELLIDLSPLMPAPKLIPPEDHQLSNESRRFWHGVTRAILDKKWSQATKLKQELEEEQRQKTKVREDSGREWKPRFFKQALKEDGRPELSEQGRKAVEGLLRGEWDLEENKGENVT